MCRLRKQKPGSDQAPTLRKEYRALSKHILDLKNVISLQTCGYKTRL